MKLLPTGISSFSQLRSRNAVYVDKTPLLYRLMTEGKYYFLSRPRRFGKSLTLSTLAEIYAGHKALFEGLWIADKWDWSKVHPVIHLNFSGINYREQRLEEALVKAVHKIAKDHELTLSGTIASELLQELIQALAAQQGQVVILIDEYDKPLTDFLQKEDLPRAYENRDTLRDFYGVVKDLDDEIEFFFMTGVSKFSQVNLFSQLNNLTDISLSPRYATLTGYTQRNWRGISASGSISSQSASQVWHARSCWPASSGGTTATPSMACGTFTTRFPSCSSCLTASSKTTGFARVRPCS
jgi:hypothetical protein